MRKIIRVSIALAATSVSAFVLLLAFSIYGFSALTDETLIAEIEFERSGEQSYLAYLRTGDFCADEIFAVLGDQWRLDAQFLKWHYWASLLGLKSHYRLERLEGRYRDAAEQNLKPTLAHALAPPSAIDIGKLSGRLGRLNFLADASYGSSTYHDIDTGLTYLVYKSPTAIFTRSRPKPNPQAPGEVLSVEVRRGCGAAPGAFNRLAKWVNRTVDPVH
ncbi:MAG TPA: hypothetical protein VIV64_01410 [Gammaproteobacteria bacterium]|jgi:hypothetical protein